MLCEKCLTKQATVHMQQFMNGDKSEIHLCADCAAQLQVQEMPVSFDNIFQGFLNTFLTGASGAVTSGASILPAVQCPRCGMSYGRFQKIGRLGCSQCYDTFKDEIISIFHNVQAGTAHQGKFPEKSGRSLALQREIDGLKKSLAIAVKNEEYEQAAALRDRIRQLSEDANGGESNDKMV